ncbi:MAG: hypothetical protein KDC38_05070 [Planctomycetes bacterium]|nr:hypothetical protein [Planctomycetota bacterium]
MQPCHPLLAALLFASPWILCGQTVVPERRASLKPSVPEGFQEIRSWWIPATETLGIEYAAWDGDRVTVEIDVRMLSEPEASHEFWREPVRWKRALAQYAGQYVVQGETDPDAGPDYDGIAGATWLTGEGYRVKMGWIVGRSPVPDGLIRAVLQKYPSALTSTARREGTQWAADELRHYWKRFGDRLRSDASSTEVIAPASCPFVIPFLDYTFVRGLSRDERLERYDALASWISGVGPADFSWDVRQGRFRFREEQVRSPRTVEVPVGSPFVLDDIPEFVEQVGWRFETQIERGAGYAGELLWAVGRSGDRDVMIVVHAADRDSSARGLVVTSIDVETGAQLASRPLRETGQAVGAELIDLRTSEAGFFLQSKEGPNQLRHGHVDPLTARIAPVEGYPDPFSFTHAPFSAASGWGWETTRLLFGPAGEDLLSLVAGRATMYARTRRGEVEAAHFLYAVDRRRHAVRWKVQVASGSPIEGETSVVVPTHSSRANTWSALDIETGDVRWSFAIPEWSTRCAGLVADRLVLVNSTHVIVVEASSGTPVARLRLEQPMASARDHRAPFARRLVLTQGGVLVLSVRTMMAGPTPGQRHSVRFYRWPRV